MNYSPWTWIIVYFHWEKYKGPFYPTTLDIEMCITINQSKIVAGLNSHVYLLDLFTKRCGYIKAKVTSSSHFTIAFLFPLCWQYATQQVQLAQVLYVQIQSDLSMSLQWPICHSVIWSNMFYDTYTQWILCHSHTRRFEHVRSHTMCLVSLSRYNVSSVFVNTGQDIML